MQDEFHARLWEAHHDRFSESFDSMLRKAAARLRGVPYLAERVAGQVAIALTAVALASSLTLTTGLA